MSAHLIFHLSGLLGLVGLFRPDSNVLNTKDKRYQRIAKESQNVRAIVFRMMFYISFDVNSRLPILDLRKKKKETKRIKDTEKIVTNGMTSSS